MHWLVHSMSDMLNSTNTDITTKGGRGRRTKPSWVSRNTATKAKHDSNRLQMKSSNWKRENKIKMHTKFHNEDTTRCSNMIGQCLHANYGIRRVKRTFYRGVVLLIGPAWSIYLLYMSIPWSYCLWRQWLRLYLVNSFKDRSCRLRCASEGNTSLLPKRP